MFIISLLLVGEVRKYARTKQSKSNAADKKKIKENRDEVCNKFQLYIQKLQVKLTKTFAMTMVAFVAFYLTPTTLGQILQMFIS
jgi:hypothetical protein